MRLGSLLCTLLCAALFVACADDVRDAPVIGPNQGGIPEQRDVSEPVEYAPRTLLGYGLPRSGEPGIADLIALMPSESVGAGETDIWAAEGDAPPCPDSGRVEILDALPMTVEGVVTLHPRQYLKVPTCDQDERNYGSFVIEDDTAGIVVLRNSRVAEYTVGDRVRVTVRAMMFTFRSPSTRVVLAADIERVERPGAEREAVLYEDLDAPFGLDDITETRRITGTIIQSPSSTNFGELLVADRVVEAPDEPVTPTPVCGETCPRRCINNQCGDRCAEFCAAICATGVGGGPELIDQIPICWAANVDQELQRRGFAPEVGRPVEVIGPVFDSFNLQMWVQRLGQVRMLDER